MSILLLSHFSQELKYTVSGSFFFRLTNLYSAQDIKNFWNTISVPINKLSGKFKKYQDINTRNSLEYYEQTPFIGFPLIYDYSKYICVDYNILYRCLETFIYDFLRSQDPSNFMNRFGKIFENYAKKTLDYSNLKYLYELEITSIIGTDSQSIDFIIQEENANIFIDAKAVEMSYRGKYSNNPVDIEHCTKKSMLKAISQAHATNFKIKEVNNPNLVFHKINYILVITFKEMYLGNGLTFYNTISKTKIDEIYSNYSTDFQIPLENIYFITISDFDRLIEHTKKNKLEISSILDIAKANDSKPSKQKFNFSQHLSDIKAFEVPPFIKDVFDNLNTKVKHYVI
jgi:hypothetical protein